MYTNKNIYKHSLVNVQTFSLNPFNHNVFFTCVVYSIQPHRYETEHFS